MQDNKFYEEENEEFMFDAASFLRKRQKKK